MATLFVLQGPDKGRTFRAADGRVVLGRESDSVPLTDRTISRRHAEVVLENDAWIIRDLNSANGTYVNGERLTKPVRLKHGDQIKLGATLLIYGSDQVSERMSGSQLARDMIDFEGRNTNMDSAILSTVSSDDSIIIAGPEVTEAARAWRVMSELISAIGVILDPEELLERVMDVILEELPVDRGFILLYDSKGEELEPHVIRYRRGTPARKQRITTSKRIIQHVVDRRESVLCTNAMTDQRFSSEASEDSIHHYGLRSVICAPIIVRDLLLGVIHIDCSAAAHTYTEQQLRLMSVIGQMTGLAAQNARLVQQQMRTARLAAVGETVAYLSHSIKNILQGMKSGADLVELGIAKASPEPLNRGWEIVKRNLERILQLSMNMLAYSKSRLPNLQQSNLNKLVEDAVSLARSRAEDKNVMLLTKYEEQLPPIPVDTEGMHQVVLNIVGNAIDAVAPNTGVVHVGTQFNAEEGIADIIVTDNGPGIEPDKIEEIFEPFKSSKGQAGTGLGLAVARKVVKEHHGRIVVESTPGEGTTFRVRLPVQELTHWSEETYSTLQ